jgi:hypothetical protein
VGMSHGQQAATYALVALGAHDWLCAREWRGVVRWLAGKVCVGEREYEKVIVLYV